MYVARYQDDLVNSELFLHKDGTVKFIVDYHNYKVEYSGVYYHKYRTFKMSPNHPSTSLFYITRTAWDTLSKQVIEDHKQDYALPANRGVLNHPGTWDL